MRALSGAATAVVAATPERCMELLEAVDRYPAWCPEMVPEVEVLERGEDGRPTRVRTRLHVARGPLVRDFELVMAVRTDQPATVRLEKTGGSEQRFDVTWRVEPHAEGAGLELLLSAELNVPRLLPLGGVGDGVARGFVAAACRELDQV